MSSSSGVDKNSPEKNNATKDGDLKSAGRLIEEEKVEEGSIPWATYQIYIQCAGGYLVAFLVMVTFIINIGSTGKSTNVNFSLRKMTSSKSLEYNSNYIIVNSVIV